MKQAGYLEVEDRDIEPLVWNVIVVLRYNIEFLRERQIISSEGSGAVVQTLEQHLTLFADKLTPEAIKYFDVAFTSLSNHDIAI
jgi:hypothetical protein